MKCSSQQAASSVFDSTGDALNPDAFTELTIEFLQEQHPIDNWVLSKFALNATNLTLFSANDLFGTIPENRVALMNLAEQTFSASQNLQRLTLLYTKTSNEVGMSVLQALLDSDIRTLTHINFSHNDEWFQGQDAAVDLLIQIINR